LSSFGIRKEKQAEKLRWY